MPDMILTPLLATAIFVVACCAGYAYRRVWKAEGPVWKLWVYGLVAGLCLLTVGFVPVSPAG
ncbi:MAG: hypothetical protein AAGC79_14145 [Pseudomonadota bacterium]